MAAESCTKLEKDGGEWAIKVTTGTGKYKVSVQGSKGTKEFEVALEVRGKLNFAVVHGKPDSTGISVLTECYYSERYGGFNSSYQVHEYTDLVSSSSETLSVIVEALKFIKWDATAERFVESESDGLRDLYQVKSDDGNPSILSGDFQDWKQIAFDEARELAHVKGFKISKGFITQGGDIETLMMTVPDAMDKAKEWPGCLGFCFRGEDARPEGCVEILFKSKDAIGTGSNPWISYLRQ